MIGDKVRLRFQKSGDLRLLSHHDLMRCVERMMRRAEIPFKMTEGFHPTPRIVYGLSLALGVAGLNEVLEVELTEPLDAETVRQRLAATTPTGLSFHAVTIIPMRQTGEPRRAVYTFPIPSDRVAVTAQRCVELMQLDQVWVARIRPKPRKLNIRPFIRSLSCDACGSQHKFPTSPTRKLGQGSSPSLRVGLVEKELPQTDGELRLDLWVTNSGAARADELIRLLELTDLLDGGAVLTRAELHLHDEEPNTDDDRPPEGKPESIAMTHADAMAATGETDLSNPTPAPQESVTE